MPEEQTTLQKATSSINVAHLVFTALIAVIVAIAPDLLSNQAQIVDGLEQICAEIDQIAEEQAGE